MCTRICGTGEYTRVQYLRYPARLRFGRNCWRVDRALLRTAWFGCLKVLNHPGILTWRAWSDASSSTLVLLWAIVSPHVGSIFYPAYKNNHPVYLAFITISCILEAFLQGKELSMPFWWSYGFLISIPKFVFYLFSSLVPRGFTVLLLLKRTSKSIPPPPASSPSPPSSPSLFDPFKYLHCSQCSHHVGYPRRNTRHLRLVVDSV